MKKLMSMIMNKSVKESRNIQVKIVILKKEKENALFTMT